MVIVAVDRCGPALNRLLAALPDDEYQALLPDLELIQVEHRQVVSRPGEPIEHVYFPRGAVISMLVPMSGGQRVEGATIGYEGMAGLPLFLGDSSSVQEEVICQVAGPGWRMTANAFRAALKRGPRLHVVLHRYTLALMGQLIRTAGCNSIHPIDERCARWLLMTADRVGADEFPLTQEFLAAMLGVQRPSVTVAAHMLQAAGVLRYRRGVVSILDRAGLEQSACEDYRLTRQIYEQLYGSELSARV